MSGRAIAICAAGGLLVVVCAALTVPANAHPDHGTATVQEDDYDVRFLLQEGDWAEVNLEMVRGGTIDWDVRTIDGGEIYLDLHSHERAVRYHLRFNRTAGESGVFEAPRDGGYSFMVENHDEHEELVQIQVSGEFALVDTLNIDPLSDNVEGAPAPAAPFVVLVSAAALAFVARRRS